MAIQTANATLAFFGSGPKQVTPAFGSNTTAGNSIIVTVGYFNNLGTATIAITDTQGNSYKQITKLGTTQGLAVYLASNIAGGADTVTVQLSNTTVSNEYDLDVIIAEYPGALEVSRYNDNGPASGTSISTNSVVPLEANSILVTAAYDFANTHSWSSGAGYTIQDSTANTFECSVLADQTVSSLGTYSNTFTFTPSSSGGAEAAIIALVAAQTTWRIQYPILDSNKQSYEQTSGHQAHFIHGSDMYMVVPGDVGFSPAYGLNDILVYKSTDEGATWSEIASVTGGVSYEGLVTAVYNDTAYFYNYTDSTAVMKVFDLSTDTFQSDLAAPPVPGSSFYKFQVAFHAYSDGTLFLALQRTSGGFDYIRYSVYSSGSWSAEVDLVSSTANFDWEIETSCMGASDLIHVFVGKVPNPFALPIHLYHVAITKTGTIGSVTQVEATGYHVYGNADIGEASADRGNYIGLPCALDPHGGTGPMSVYAIVGDDSLNPTFGPEELMWNGDDDDKNTADSWGAAPMLGHSSIFFGGKLQSIFTVLTNNQNDTSITQGRFYYAERTAANTFSMDMIYESPIPNILQSPYFTRTPGPTTDLGIFFSTFDVSIFFSIGTKWDALHLGAMQRLVSAPPTAVQPQLPRWPWNPSQTHPWLPGQFRKMRRLGTNN